MDLAFFPKEKRMSFLKDLLGKLLGTDAKPEGQKTQSPQAKAGAGKERNRLLRWLWRWR